MRISVFRRTPRVAMLRVTCICHRVTRGDSDCAPRRTVVLRVRRVHNIIHYV